MSTVFLHPKRKAYYHRSVIPPQAQAESTHTGEATRHDGRPALSHFLANFRSLRGAVRALG